MVSNPETVRFGEDKRGANVSGRSHSKLLSSSEVVEVEVEVEVPVEVVWVAGAIFTSMVGAWSSFEKMWSLGAKRGAWGELGGNLEVRAVRIILSWRRMAADRRRRVKKRIQSPNS